jgi:hypothetical protein
MSDISDKMSDGPMKDYRITVRFPAELRRRLKASARRSGTRESDLVGAQWSCNSRPRKIHSPRTNMRKRLDLLGP